MRNNNRQFKKFIQANNNIKRFWKYGQLLGIQCINYVAYIPEVKYCILFQLL